MISEKRQWLEMELHAFTSLPLLNSFPPDMHWLLSCVSCCPLLCSTSYCSVTSWHERSLHAPPPVNRGPAHFPCRAQCGWERRPPSSSALGLDDESNASCHDQTIGMKKSVEAEERERESSSNVLVGRSLRFGGSRDSIRLIELAGN